MPIEDKTDYIKIPEDNVPNNDPWAELDRALSRYQPLFLLDEAYTRRLLDYTTQEKVHFTPIRVVRKR